jgi:O-antigen/teichoic acid export membrane protein
MKAPIIAAIRNRIGSRDLLEILVRGASIALLIQIAGNGVGYGAQILLARWLGVAQYGNYTYLVTWAQVFTIGALLGLDFGMVRFIPEYSILKDRERLRGILIWSRGLVFAAGAVLAAVSTVVLLSVHPVQTSSFTIVLGSLLIPLIALSEVQTQIIRGAKRIGWAYAPPILFHPLLVLGAAVCFLRGWGGLTDFDSIAATCVSLCIIVVVQGIVIQRLFSGSVRTARAAYDGRRWLAISMPLLANSVLSVVLLRVDTLMVGFFLGSEEVGIYGASVKTATIVGIALLAANTIVGPMIASAYARKDMTGLQNLVSLATLGSFIASLVIGTGVVLFNSPLLQAFGGEFLRARLPLFILILGQLVNVGSGSVGLLLVLTGHERQSLFVLGWCTLATCAACILVIPSHGIVGAAAVSMLGVSLWNVWSYRMVVKYLGIRPSIFFAVKKLIWQKE